MQKKQNKIKQNKKQKAPHHTEPSLLISKANQLTAFYMTRAPAARHFQTDYDAIPKKVNVSKRNVILGITFYFLLEKSLHDLHGQLLGFQVLISCLKFSRLSIFLNFSGRMCRIFGRKYDILSVP